MRHNYSGQEVSKVRAEGREGEEIEALALRKPGLNSTSPLRYPQ